jgi:hypothetical protein
VQLSGWHLLQHAKHPNALILLHLHSNFQNRLSSIIHQKLSYGPTILPLACACNTIINSILLQSLNTLYRIYSIFFRSFYLIRFHFVIKGITTPIIKADITRVQSRLENLKWFELYRTIKTTKQQQFVLLQYQCKL